MSATRNIVLIILSLVARPAAASDECTFGVPFYTAPAGYEAHYGHAVAVENGRAVIGAFTEIGATHGRAYFYSNVVYGPYSVWQESEVPAPASAGMFSQFGFAVDLDGSTAAIGARDAVTAGPYCGAVFIYQVGDFSVPLIATLTASDAHQFDSLGHSVALAGDTVVAGATQGVEFDEPGAVYVFDRVGAAWTETAKLLSPVAQPGDWFGAAVDLDGDILVVGAPYYDDEFTHVGRSFIFERSDGDWTVSATLFPQLPQWQGQFGHAVAVCGETVAIGSPGTDIEPDVNGVVYVYHRCGGEWTLQATLTADEAADGAADSFGSSLCLRGDSLAIGAPDADEDGVSAGAAYLFTRSGSSWVQRARIVSLQPSANDQFGESVSVYDGNLLVGASRDDTEYVNSGSATFFVPTCPVVPPIGDLDHDDVVATLDLQALTRAWGACDSDGPSTCCPADLDGDGDVDGHDLAVLLATWGSH